MARFTRQWNRRTKITSISTGKQSNPSFPKYFSGELVKIQRMDKTMAHLPNTSALSINSVSV